MRSCIRNRPVILQYIDAVADAMYGLRKGGDIIIIPVYDFSEDINTGVLVKKHQQLEEAEYAC